MPARPQLTVFIYKFFLHYCWVVGLADLSHFSSRAVSAVFSDERQSKAFLIFFVKERTGEQIGLTSCTADKC